MTSERLKERNFFICQAFSFYMQLKLRAQLGWVWQKFYNLKAWLISGHSLHVWLAFCVFAFWK